MRSREIVKTAAFDANGRPFGLLPIGMFPTDLMRLPGLGNHAKYRTFLWLLARQLPSPKVMVELGTDTGVTAAFLSSGKNPDDRLISVDIDTSLRIVFNELAEFIKADSLDFLRDYSGELVSLFFLDTDHTYERVSQEYRLVKPLLAPGGIVCVDDILLNEGMRRFWDEVREEKLDLSELHTQLQAPHLPRGTGFGVIFP